MSLENQLMIAKTVLHKLSWEGSSVNWWARQALNEMNNLEGDSVMDQEFLLQFFAYSHLPTHLQEVSRPFGELADKIFKDLFKNPERTTALRKLLEAKDCAVRALVAK